MNLWETSMMSFRDRSTVSDVPWPTESVEGLSQSLVDSTFAHFDSGPCVAIVTVAGEVTAGVTESVSTLASGPDERLILIVLDERSDLGRAVRHTEHLGLAVLGPNQSPLVRMFETEPDSALLEVSVDVFPSGCPRLRHAMMQVDLVISECVQVGDRLMLLARIRDVASAALLGQQTSDGRGRRFGQERDEATYRSVRDAVLRRDLKPGEQLEVDSLAERLSVDERCVAYALDRLVYERLVTRSGAMSFTVRPVDEPTVTRMLHARLFLLTGIVESLGPALTSTELGRIRAVAEATVRQADVPSFGLVNEGFVNAFRGFNEAIVSLAGNELLLEMYRALSVPTLIGLVTQDVDWSELHDRLSDAALSFCEFLEEQDFSGAVSALTEFNDNVRDYILRLIEAKGGAI